MRLNRAGVLSGDRRKKKGHPRLESVHLPETQAGGHADSCFVPDLHIIRDGLA